MGNVLTLLARPSFVPERDIPDLPGKVVLVTGGNTGIGYHIVKQLLLKHAKVYIAGRSAERVAAAIKSLEAETNGKKAVFLELDLGDLKSVRKAAESFLEKEERTNYSGLYNCSAEMLTGQGLDLQFGTNVLGHFFFTELLLPALTKSSEHNKVPARVINTSSRMHTSLSAPLSGVDLVTVKGGPERDLWVKKAGKLGAPLGLYGQSKFIIILVSNYWAKRYPDVLVSCAVNPGGSKSDIARHQPRWKQRIVNFNQYPTPMGALAQLWAGTVATPAQIAGQYLVPWGKVGKADERTIKAKLEEEAIGFLKEQIQGF